MPDPVNQWLSIRSNDLSAQIDPFGAQLSRFQDAAGRDLLGAGDPAFWTGRAPLLFPIVGGLQDGTYRWRGQRYALPRHGFARTLPFEIVEHDDETALLRLRPTAATRASYPFEFALEVRFSILAQTLSLRVRIANEGAERMPASFGFHPSFRWPLPYGQDRLAHRIEFETEEPEPIRRLDSQGLIEPASVPTPVRQRTLLLNDSLFERDALIFDRIRSRWVSYGADAGPCLHIGFPDTPYLGIWSKPGAPFVCIEPWHGIADPVGSTGELIQKPGLFELAPGEAREMAVDITWLAR